MCKQTFTGHESDINAVAVSFKLFSSFELNTVNFRSFDCAKSVFFFGHSILFCLIDFSISPMEMHLQQGQMMLPVGCLTSVLIR